MLAELKEVPDYVELCKDSRRHLGRQDLKRAPLKLSAEWWAIYWTSQKMRRQGMGWVDEAGLASLGSEHWNHPWDLVGACLATFSPVDAVSFLPESGKGGPHWRKIHAEICHYLLQCRAEGRPIKPSVYGAELGLFSTVVRQSHRLDMLLDRLGCQDLHGGILRFPEEIQVTPVTAGVENWTRRIQGALSLDRPDGVTPSQWSVLKAYYEDGSLHQEINGPSRMHLLDGKRRLWACLAEEGPAPRPLPSPPPPFLEALQALRDEAVRNAVRAQHKYWFDTFDLFLSSQGNSRPEDTIPSLTFDFRRQEALPDDDPAAARPAVRHRHTTWQTYPERAAAFWELLNIPPMRVYRWQKMAG